MDLAPGDTVSLELAGFTVPPTLPAHTDATYAFSVAGRTLVLTAKVAVPRGGAQAVLVPALFGIRLPDVGTGNTRCCARLGTCCVKVPAAPSTQTLNPTSQSQKPQPYTPDLRPQTPNPELPTQTNKDIIDKIEKI